MWRWAWSGRRASEARPGTKAAVRVAGRVVAREVVREAAVREAETAAAMGAARAVARAGATMAAVTAVATAGRAGPVAVPAVLAVRAAARVRLAALNKAANHRPQLQFVPNCHAHGLSWAVRPRRLRDAHLIFSPAPARRPVGYNRLLSEPPRLVASRYL